MEMAGATPLSEHLSPDCISRLEHAAKRRFREAEQLGVERAYWPGAVYLYGCRIEMCLTAAYFRSAGFSPNTIIEPDIRRSRMAYARGLKTETGDPVMDSDPHPLVGWAQFLMRTRMAAGKSQEQNANRLREAVNRARIAYKHWRPELRYKATDVAAPQLDEIR